MYAYICTCMYEWLSASVYMVACGKPQQHCLLFTYYRDAVMHLWSIIPTSSPHSFSTHAQYMGTDRVSKNIPAMFTGHLHNPHPQHNVGCLLFVHQLLVITRGSLQLHACTVACTCWGSEGITVDFIRTHA